MYYPHKHCFDTGINQKLFEIRYPSSNFKTYSCTLYKRVYTFYLSTTRISMQYHLWYIFFYQSKSVTFLSSVGFIISCRRKPRKDLEMKGIITLILQLAKLDLPSEEYRASLILLCTHR